VLAASAKSDLKRITFELGGNSPQIVFDNADFDNAVENMVMPLSGINLKTS